MLAVLRLIILGLFIVASTIAGCVFFLFRPKNPNNTHLIAKWYSSMRYIMGIEVEVRIPDELKKLGPCVYIANHQNSYDLFTLTKSVMPKTVSVGKKSLKWIPFFGQLYWLSGNILIDRKNRHKAFDTISQAAKKIRERKISVWLFPEGTRSYGKGLLPFKTGAFHTALQAGVPIIPVCMSSTHKKFSLNRWRNGKVIIEMLPPVDMSRIDKNEIREMAIKVHQMMRDKISTLDHQIRPAHSA
ncbi:1-acylglycerol-3-phosphate O-acyltransferase [Algicola sagamiensis]|uniref:1-acylglycerol-3-phosphate O-acyltransferase n=1 Tax=Algicola sagamiensis TaxID=163869 RepID=UPI00037C8551|nr:1-acylglycerol-3-phosphate O-acyltransferase [Algicola sagamiensis]